MGYLYSELVDKRNIGKKNGNIFKITLLLEQINKRIVGIRFFLIFNCRDVKEDFQYRESKE